MARAARAHLSSRAARPCGDITRTGARLICVPATRDYACSTTLRVTVTAEPGAGRRGAAGRAGPARTRARLRTRCTEGRRRVATARCRGLGTGRRGGRRGAGGAHGDRATHFFLVDGAPERVHARLGEDARATPS